MSMKRRTFFAAAAAVAARPALAQAPPRARTLVIAQNFDPTSLWPNATTASDNINAGAQIVESLFWIDPRSNKAEPLLAESFSQEGPTAVRIVLRPGVTFSNGEPMDADAVVHSLNLFMDAKTTPAYAIYTPALAGAEKIDDRTVRVTTKYPYPAIGLVLTQVFVVPPKYWASAGPAGFGQKPVGTGPFTLTEWVKDSRLVMDRNPAYWGKGPGGVDRLVWRPVPDDTARAAGLMAGEFDLTSALAITDVAQIEADSKLQVAAAPSFRVYTIILSSLAEHPSALHDKRVRQALNYAIDREAIRGSILSPDVVPATQFIVPSINGHNPNLKPWPFDPAKAKALLAEAKAAGTPVDKEITIYVRRGNYAGVVEANEAILAMLQDVGFNVKLQIVEVAEWVDLYTRPFAENRPPNLVHAMHDNNNGDAVFTMFFKYHTDGAQSALSDPRVDKAIEAATVAVNPERQKLWQEVVRLVNEEIVADVPLFHMVGYTRVGNRVNFKPSISTNSEIQLATITFR